VEDTEEAADVDPVEEHQEQLRRLLEVRWARFMKDIAVEDHEEVRRFLTEKMEGPL